MSETAKSTFKVGDCVIYPSHGLGKITAEEIQTVAGSEVRLYVISFEKDKMILRVPKSRAAKAGLRHLTSSINFSKAMDVLRQKAKISRGMWSKRAQEYEAKINSGDVVKIAEVLRDLHKGSGDVERSYSERVIYESALERISHEYSISLEISKCDAAKRLIEILDFRA